MAGRILNVAEAGASVERSGDEPMPRGMRAGRLRYARAACEPADDPAWRSMCWPERVLNSEPVVRSPIRASSAADVRGASAVFCRLPPFAEPGRPLLLSPPARRNRLDGGRGVDPRRHLEAVRLRGLRERVAVTNRRL